MRHSLGLRAVLPAALLAAACGGGPPPAKTTVLSTSYQDRDVGQDAARDVAAELGLVDDPELTRYVGEIGRRLVRYAPPRPFDYQFSIVDQFEPNAFALPGGYIFISRGLLALANSEDELAGVIGHEIIHAVNRHSAARQEVARRQGPLAMPYVRMAQLAAYGRDQERDADDGGQRLAAAAGYDPKGLTRFLEQLNRVERLRIGHSRLPSFFDTHPGTLERAASTAARARTLHWQRSPDVEVGRAAYYARIDGIALGPRPSEGIFEGSAFLHPDLDLHLRFPGGWRLVNTHRVVGAISPKGDAMIFMEVQGPAGDPKLAAEDFVAQGAENRIEVQKAYPVKIGPIEAYRIEANGFMAGANVAGLVTFIPHNGMMFRITGVAPRMIAEKYLGRARNTARSFRPLTDEERTLVKGLIVHVVTARPGEDLAALGERTHNAWGPQLTAVLNGVFTDARFAGGDPVKVAATEPYQPQPVDPRAHSISR